MDLKAWRPTVEVGIVFEGGGDSDTIKVVGTSASETYLFTSDSLVIGDTTIYLTGTQNVTVDGGDGNDTYRFTGLAAASTTLSDKKGVDTFDFGDASTGVTLNLANTKSQQILGKSLIVKTAPEILIGTEFADTLSGTRNGQVLYGGGGSDRISAVSGKNVLIGGAAADAIFGGSSEDLLIGDDVAQDALFELYNGWIASKSKFDARATSLGRIGDEIVSDDVTDSLTGGKGQDWFFGEDEEFVDFDEASRSPDRRN